MREHKDINRLSLSHPRSNVELDVERVINTRRSGARAEGGGAEGGGGGGGEEQEDNEEQVAVRGQTSCLLGNEILRRSP